MGKISVREEAAGTPGFVEIAIAGPASGVAGVTIKQRHGDKPFLGQDGWQGQPAVLAPVRVTEGERETVLLYGPAVTQNLVLDQDVTVQLPDGTSERHFWPHIADALGGATVDLGIPRAASPVTGSGSGPNRPPVGPGPPVGDPPIDPPLTLPVEPRPRKHLWLGLLLAGLLLLAAGITAYFLRDRLWPPVEQTVISPTPVPETVAEPEPPAQPSFAQRYETLRDGGTNADELHALAVEAAAADDDDIGFRAMTLAAERGSAEASLQVGKWYDPGIREGSPFPIPDPSAAARHYLAAEETGSEEAGPLRRKLCELAEQAPDADRVHFETFSTDTYCR